MKTYWKRLIGYVLPVVLLLVILICRNYPAAGEWYALHVYPYVSMVLSSFSSLFPFSLGDLFIFLSVAWVIIYPFYAWRRRLSWKHTLLKISVYLLWIFVWFYLAWGLNYFRKDFYTRTSIDRTNYTPEEFDSFLNRYVSELNASYIPVTSVDKDNVALEVRKGYRSIDPKFGLALPQNYQRAKNMLFSPFISQVGVSGYMGPFFSEFNLNADLLPVQYSSVYAHELAHLLGITSEAEANLYSFIICTASKDPQIRFSGYFALLPYVLGNARNFLTEVEYDKLVKELKPEVVELYEFNRNYWIEKYNPLVGDVQDVVYDWFLKGNNIGSGMQNYSEVIGLLISLYHNDKK